MSLKLKRRCTYATIFFYNLCCGINYGIIFPTVWDYVHLKFHGNSINFGFVIAAYSISSFLIQPFITYWENQTSNSRTILLFSVFAELIGSIMYFLGYSSWFLAGSRFVSGLGGNAISLMKLDVACSTLEDNRKFILILVDVFQHFGLIIGPIFNLFLSSIKFNIGSLIVDKYSSPGWFMALLWILVIWSIALFYYDLSALKSEEGITHLFSGYGKKSSLSQEPYPSDVENSADQFMTTSFPNYCSTLHADNSLKNNQSLSVPNLSFKYLLEHLSLAEDDYCNGDIPSKNHKVAGIPIIKVKNSSNDSNVADNMIETAERFIQSSSMSFGNDNLVETNETNSNNSEFQKCSEIVASNSSSFKKEKRFCFKELCSFKSEIVVLLSLVFYANFSQTFLETIITPLDQKIYQYTDKENSIVYFCIGVELMFLFFFIHYMSNFISERYIILIGVGLQCGSLIISFLFLADRIIGQTFHYFLIFVILFLFGTSSILLCATSLAFKISVPDFQIQKYHWIFSSLGFIFGPLWGGAYLNKLNYLYIGPLGFLIFISALCLCSFKHLKSEK